MGQALSRGGNGSKKIVQQGRSPFHARSVLIVREHGKRARTPLAAFFNIPLTKIEGDGGKAQDKHGDRQPSHPHSTPT